MATSVSSRPRSSRDHDQDEDIEASRPGVPIDPLRLWTAIRKRKAFILIAGILGAFIGAAVAKKFAAQTFVAHGVLTWESGAVARNVERTTVIESMTMSSNLEEVRRRLKLSMPLRLLRENLSVESSDGSNNVVIEAKWPSGAGAAQLVNTVIDVFLERRDRLVRDHLTRTVERQSEAEVDTRQRQEQALKAYEDFRRSAGFNDISHERELAITQYADLAAKVEGAKSRAEHARVEAETSESEARAARSSGAAPELDEKQAASDAARLVQARSELGSALRNYSEEHPTVRRLRAEVEGLEQRVRAFRSDPGRRRERAEAAESKRQAAVLMQGQLRTRLDALSAAEGKAAVLLGELKVAEEAHARATEALTASQLEAAQPQREFRIHERGSVPRYAEQSPRKRIAIAFPIGFFLLAVIGSVLWSLRGLDVRTPKEAAFWSGVPVVGASTWPRDPDMLASLMHDLDDFAPHAEGITLIVGLSLSEAHLARKVAEWDPRRISQAFDDPTHVLTSGAARNLLPSVTERGSEAAEARDVPPPQRQIMTLTGPVPAQALRRAARLADRVLVVVTSGRHSVTQLLKIRGRLGRDKGIGVLLVGLERDFAMVRDRVGDVGEFWQTTTARSS
jgi:uncharacterized protein involved in exopolysaccharide biosynthesis